MYHWWLALAGCLNWKSEKSLSGYRAPQWCRHVQLENTELQPAVSAWMAAGSESWACISLLCINSFPRRQQTAHLKCSVFRAWIGKNSTSVSAALMSIYHQVSHLLQMSFQSFLEALGEKNKISTRLLHYTLASCDRWSTESSPTCRSVHVMEAAKPRQAVSWVVWIIGCILSEFLS